MAFSNLTPVTKTFSYNAVGSIVTKSDHGAYSYPAQGVGSVRPHAVSSVVTASGTKTYAYDANGNMTSGDGRTLTWTPFNMPLAITQGASTLTFAYDTERQRIKQVAPDGTTHYINDTSAGLKVEKFIGASSMRWNNYVYAAGGIVAVVYDNVGGTSSTRYFHKDHLGSTAVITNETGGVVETLAYDPWGKRRHPNGNDDPTNSITSLTDRGFTGHEHLQEVALVHMNGRVYDPLLGRFLSADPHIQDPGDTQSLNRYAYVKNNPLAYTDPSGFFFKSIMKFFQKNPIAAMVVGIAVAWATGGISLLATGGFNITLGGAITAGATSGLLTGGIKGAILGGISGAITAGIGDLGLGFMGDAAFLGKAALHGVAQGTLAAVQGGDFGSAFLSASFASVGGSLIGKPSGVGSLIAKTVASAVIGGTASVIGGGKFQNGAATGAFVYLFNHAHETLSKLATSVELRFRSVLGVTPFDHAYIIVTDNVNGGQTISEGSPFGPPGDGSRPVFGSIEASIEPYGKHSSGYTERYTLVASFDADVAATKIVEMLRSFSGEFNKLRIPYLIESLNSNSYGGPAWEMLTGSIPKLPSNLRAPGWADSTEYERR